MSQLMAYVLPVLPLGQALFRTFSQAINGLGDASLQIQLSRELKEGKIKPGTLHGRAKELSPARPSVGSRSTDVPSNAQKNEKNASNTQKTGRKRATANTCRRVAKLRNNDQDAAKSAAKFRSALRNSTKSRNNDYNVAKSSAKFGNEPTKSPESRNLEGNATKFSGELRNNEQDAAKSTKAGDAPTLAIENQLLPQNFATAPAKDHPLLRQRRKEEKGSDTFRLCPSN
jgi:hypothetical protein